VSKRRMKRPNALMHGGFSKFNILPGEDASEFDRLLADLVKEWAPQGPTEADAVLTLAKCIWRKARLQKFLELGCRIE
jgi:hypothetical protein